VEDRALSSVGDVEAGDCVIAFSRRNIHAIKKLIESDGKHSCCVVFTQFTVHVSDCSEVYGALPPESRKQQAYLFNERDNEYNVLVASDAIGMGLNLDIRRIVFSAVEKFDGTRFRYLSIPEVKQISGRAGRYGSVFPDGLITTAARKDIPFIKYTLSCKTLEVKTAGLLPRQVLCRRRQ